MASQKSAANKQELYIAGVGASAGGLDALKVLVKHLPLNDLKLAIVVAQHISPDYESKLKSLLSAPLNWKIMTAENGQALKACSIYLTPPGHNISIKKGKIKLTAHKRKTSPVPSIDGFLESLAENSGPRAIGIILSGTGHDGAAGISAIKNRKGFTVAQQPNEASHQDMPEAAIGTGQVDVILPTIRMGVEMESFIHNFNVVQNEPEKVTGLQAILKMLTAGLGTDFSAYKANTVQRRINKRIQHLHLEDVEEYRQHIRENPAELNRLFETMLIGVTEFFRDKEAYNALRDYLKKIIGDKKPGDNIRLWSVGCATGEEPYGLAILLTELLGEAIHQYNIQIFATDISQNALALARKAVYREEQLANLPKAAVKKCFMEMPGGYEVKRSLRQYVLFAKHDITTDPPFVKLDLISCRNVLIYFNNDLQKRVLPVFHYALNQQGYLFLGKSESTSQFTNLFEVVNKKAKIYSKNPNTQINTLSYANFTKAPRKTEEQTIAPGPELSLGEIAEKTLVKNYEHPYVVIGAEMEVHLIKGSLRPYLDISEGSLNSNLTKILHRSLHLELRSCFKKVKESKEACVSQTLRFKIQDTEHYLKLRIKPLIYGKNEKEHYLVIFEKINADERFLLPEGLEKKGEDYDSAIKIVELEQELAATREHLEMFAKEEERVGEELQTLNEELQSANEEMKSANEELETSNEELESANEELHTTNREMSLTNQNLISNETKLQKLNEELETTHDRYKMAISNSRIFISYQDKDLKYQWFSNRSPRFKKQGIVGKTDLEVLGEGSQGMTEAKKEVLNSGNEFSGEMQFGDAHWEVSIKPVKEKEVVIGVKTVAFDVTERKEAEAVLRQRESELEAAISATNLGTWAYYPLRDDFNISHRAKEIYALPRDGDITFETALNAICSDDWQRNADAIGRALDPKLREHYTIECQLNDRGDDELRWIRSAGQASFNASGEVEVFIGTVQDITQRKEMEKQKDDFLSIASHELKTPVTSIKGYIQMLIEDFSGDNEIEAVSQLQTVDRQVNKLIFLINDLLDTQKIESGKIQLNKSLFNFDELLDEVVQAMQYVAPHHRLQLRGNTGKKVYADRNRIEQVLINLISNAVKFSPEADQISLATELNNGELTLSVRDYGVGIKAENLPKVFERFYRDDHTSQWSSGLGLGLYISAEIIKRHQGSLHVESELNKGSVFYLTLPHQN